MCHNKCAVQNLTMNFLVLILMFVSTCNCHFRPLFKDPVYKTIPEFPKINEENGEHRIVVYHDLTMALIDFTSEKIIRCEVIDINQLKNKHEALQNLTYPKTEVSFNDMHVFMDQCDMLDDDYEQTLSEKFSVFNIIKKIVSGGYDFVWHGTYPGTNYCGKGDSANGYHDLGIIRDVDRCCRAHDLCPERVEGHSQKFGLENNTPMTRSHCACDEKFNACLNKIDSIYSRHVKLKFFTLLKPTCVADLPSGNKTFKEFYLYN